MSGHGRHRGASPEGQLAVFLLNCAYLLGAVILAVTVGVTFGKGFGFLTFTGILALSQARDAWRRHNRGGGRQVVEGSTHPDDSDR